MEKENRKGRYRKGRRGERLSEKGSTGIGPKEKQWERPEWGCKYKGERLKRRETSKSPYTLNRSPSAMERMGHGEEWGTYGKGMRGHESEVRAVRKIREVKGDERVRNPSFVVYTSSY